MQLSKILLASLSTAFILVPPCFAGPQKIQLTEEDIRQFFVMRAPSFLLTDGATPGETRLGAGVINDIPIVYSYILHANAYLSSEGSPVSPERNLSNKTADYTVLKFSRVMDGVRGAPDGKYRIVCSWAMTSPEPNQVKYVPSLMTGIIHLDKRTITHISSPEKSTIVFPLTLTVMHTVSEPR
jgi:hypothetical protein